MAVAPAGMRILRRTVQPVGHFGSTGLAAGVPWVTPSVTLLSESEYSLLLCEVIQTRSMRGLDGSPALTAGVWPPAWYARVMPSLADRWQTATPAPTLYLRSERPDTASPSMMPVFAHCAWMILRCVSGVTPLPAESGLMPNATVMMMFLAYM